MTLGLQLSRVRASADINMQKGQSLRLTFKNNIPVSGSRASWTGEACTHMALPSAGRFAATLTSLQGCNCRPCNGASLQAAGVLLC